MNSMKLETIKAMQQIKATRMCFTKIVSRPTNNLGARMNLILLFYSKFNEILFIIEI